MLLTFKSRLMGVLPASGLLLRAEANSLRLRQSPRHSKHQTNHRRLVRHYLLKYVWKDEAYHAQTVLKIRRSRRGATSLPVSTPYHSIAHLFVMSKRHVSFHPKLNQTSSIFQGTDPRTFKIEEKVSFLFDKNSSVGTS